MAFLDNNGNSYELRTAYTGAVIQSVHKLYLGNSTAGSVMRGDFRVGGIVTVDLSTIVDPDTEPPTVRRSNRPVLLHIHQGGSFPADWSAFRTKPYPAGTATVEPVDDVPAHGMPTVTGTAMVGSTLSASTTGIKDDNGLTGVTFQYQWQRADAGQTNWTNIAGETSTTYEVTTEDEGKILRVVVSFNDEDRYAATLESDATGAVEILGPLEFSIAATVSTAVEPAPGETATAANSLVFTVSSTRQVPSNVTVT